MHLLFAICVSIVSQADVADAEYKKPIHEDWQCHSNNTRLNDCILHPIFMPVTLKCFYLLRQVHVEDVTATNCSSESAEQSS